MRSLVKQAEKLLSQPPVEHVLIGPRLLQQSRRALDRITLLAGLHQLQPDRRWVDRARKEMLAACTMADWNPSHFLDTAEMSAAVAIGYDWLYEQWTAEERTIFREAMIRLGLTPGIKAYEENGWWPKVTHNWNQVCNGGMTMAALAIADESPEIANRVLDHARKSIAPSMKSFAPDGGIAEGPGYWAYATKYTVFYLATIESALGEPSPLMSAPGFDRTGFFRIHSVGPIGLTFNFADANDGDGRTAQMFWLGHQFNQPAFIADELARIGDRAEMLHLLWYRKPATDPQAALKALPLDAYFEGIQVAFFRGTWADPKAMYVGFKGGDNHANHSHLDQGTFVLDAGGVRWVMDLAGDDYNLPGYFGKQRWEYYRLRTEGHNTLVINDHNQDPAAKAPIVAYQSTPARAHAVADLDAAYRADGAKVKRGVALLDRNCVLVQDEIHGESALRIDWAIHTLATVKLTAGGRRLTLTDKSGVTMFMEVDCPGAAFEVLDVNPPAPQKQTPGLKKVRVRLNDRVGDTTIRVLFWSDGPAKWPDAQPLAKWKDGR